MANATYRKIYGKTDSKEEEKHQKSRLWLNIIWKNKQTVQRYGHPSETTVMSEGISGVFARKKHKGGAENRKTED